MSLFRELREKSVCRAIENFKTYSAAGPLYFGVAVAGELGELLNLIKKMERARVGGPDIGHSSRLADITPERLRDEFGGILIYLDLLASFYHIDLERAIVETFNRVSGEINSPYFLSGITGGPK